jgi:aspartate/methionine/tyrosine aminotransferase
MNPHVQKLPASLIRAINARKRPGDIDFGLGEPTMRPELSPFVAATAWVRRNGCPYSPNAGFTPLREAVARYLAVPGWETPENVCITVGSEEALFLAIKTLVDPARDEVLVVEPCYLAYPKICIMESIRHRMVPLSEVDGFTPRAETVLAAVTENTRLIVLNTPANPTGRVWPHAELRGLAAGLRERHDIYILADEVYRELFYTAERPVSAARDHPRTVVAGSLSKSNALTGLRLGWIAGPTDVIASATRVHQFVNTAADTFAQRVALELLADPEQLGLHRPGYQKRRAVLLAEAKRLELAIIPPEGAFYAMLRLPASLKESSLAAAERLLDEERVVTVPGLAFGAAAEGWLRISWGLPESDLREGLARIAAFFERVS